MLNSRLDIVAFFQIGIQVAGVQKHQYIAKCKHKKISQWDNDTGAAIQLSLKAPCGCIAQQQKTVADQNGKEQRVTAILFRISDNQ